MMVLTVSSAAFLTGIGRAVSVVQMDGLGAVVHVFASFFVVCGAFAGAVLALVGGTHRALGLGAFEVGGSGGVCLPIVWRRYRRLVVRSKGAAASSGGMSFACRSVISGCSVA